MVRPLRAIVISLAVAAAVPSIGMAHPLHTSLARMTVDSHTGIIDVSLRVFIDDFTAATQQWMKRNPSRPGASSPAEYARASFIVRESTGRLVTLRSCGEKRVGDLMWLCLRGRLSQKATASAVLSRVLVEKFDDQVNIVQASVSNRKANLLFIAGDGEKRLPW